MTAVIDSPPSLRGGWRLSRVGGSAVSSTRSVTRVESISPDDKPRAKLDWLNCTFDTPSMSRGALLEFLGECMAGPLSMKLDGGLFGFEERWRVTCHVQDGTKVEVGALAMGGESQRGRWLLQLTGKGCGLVTDWSSLQEFLVGLDASLSRVDLAVDFLEGQHSVDDAVDLYESGAFINRGRNPELDVQGAWNQSGLKGRTVYVGKLKNGKSLCVYEKGKQLGDLESDWTRFEVRLGNRDRVIPLEVLTDPDRFFAGAYPALAGLLETASESVPTVHAEAKTSIAHLLHHMRRCYGKVIFQTVEQTQVSAIDLMEEMRVIGIPRRVDVASASAGLQWPELQAQLKRISA
jgi:phage replication initiation protein